MKAIRSCAGALAAGLALFFANGCGPFWVNPYITVTESKLNWMEVHYYRTDTEPVRRMSLFMNGAGYVEFKKGSSELISNDFAKRHDSDEWGKIKYKRCNVDPKHVNDIFQNLVNHGLLDSEKHFKGAKNPRKGRMMGVKANINNYSYAEQANIFEVDPDLAEQLLDVIREFDNPNL
jgi:hypothetical protein